MFKMRTISLLFLGILLLVGCKKPTVVENNDSIENPNTLNNPDLGFDTGNLQDYWYDLDEGIEAQFLYYNAYITTGTHTINSPSTLNPYVDTLNFRTFPYYTVPIENSTIDTISYMIGLKPENVDNFSTLYPLDETNTSTQEWCNNILVEYEGNCPDTIEVSFDYQFSASGTGAISDDDTSSVAVFSSLLSKKVANFSQVWSNIDSLVWDPSVGRYDIKTAASAQSLTATLIDSSDSFDSLIYIGVIDTNRYDVNDLMYVDRTQWERYDTTYQSDTKTISLSTEFVYTQIKVPADSPMYRVNGDCNQNLEYDVKEEYFDYGADWCPDSLETGAGQCEVVDTDQLGDEGYGEIFDESPCNCLGDWRETINGVPNQNYMGNSGNPDWEPGSTLDPNGDNWRDCGWDTSCPGDSDYSSFGSSPDFNGTEGNGIWDRFEGREENDQYDLDFVSGTTDWFNDLGNDISNEPAEFCASITQDINGKNVCAGTTPFEDRNCNGVWDDAESEDKGNGIWDDNESYTDTNDDGSWQSEEPLYTISDRLETFIVDYSNPSNPKAVTNLNQLTGVTLFYGVNSGNPSDSVLTQYNSFLQGVQITAPYTQSFYDIDRKETIYTNKIIEYPLPGESSDYKIVKIKWFQDLENNGDFAGFNFGIGGTNLNQHYAYDYHLFKTAENGDIIKMVHPQYFNYYGYYNSAASYAENSWEGLLAEEEIYIYTYNGLLRSGEYYNQDTTIITSVADYYIETLYEVDFDSSVKVPFKRKRYYLQQDGDTACFTDNQDYINDNFIADAGFDTTWNQNYLQNCLPADTTLTNTFKITKTKTMTMIGNGLELGFRNTFWLASGGVGVPLGIVKDQLEIRWSEPYWEEYESGWSTISCLYLASLRKTEDESSNLLRFFQPIKRISLHKLANEGKFDHDPYIFNSSFGIHRLKPSNEK